MKRGQKRQRNKRQQSQSLGEQDSIIALDNAVDSNLRTCPRTEIHRESSAFAVANQSISQHPRWTWTGRLVGFRESISIHGDPRLPSYSGLSNLAWRDGDGRAEGKQQMNSQIAKSRERSGRGARGSLREIALTRTGV
ncbi:hypothetical protein HN011_009224 [Eciton burchellii]|nr:hypothetical protein HN011_009224 [Eciton burchellii]